MRRQRKRQRDAAIRRAIVGFGLSLAGLVVGSAAFLTGGSDSDSPPIIADLHEDAIVVQSRPRLAAANLAPGDTTDPRIDAQPDVPVIRAPAPVEALAATRVRSVSGLSSRIAGTGGASAEPGFSVRLLVGDDDALAALAQAIVGRLSGHGIDAQISGLEAAGRPDALLALGLDGEQAAMEAWYCDAGPQRSQLLAAYVLEATGRLPRPAGSDALEPQTANEGLFPCDTVHSGRAQTAGVLVELSPPMVVELGVGAAVADSLADGVERYFIENQNAVRQARNVVQLDWPARGPVTSHYGPSHPLGIDIGQARGNVVAATDGTVVWWVATRAALTAASS